jgi:malonate transporter
LTAILESVLPLFAVIFLGFFAGRAGFLGESGIRGLGAFVFNFAIPPHVFRLMAETELGAITEWGFLGGYFLAQALAFAIGAGIGRKAFGMATAEMTIQAFGSAFSNGVMLALPLLLWLYGDAGGVPALLIITLDVIVFSSVTVLLELGRGGDGRAGPRVVVQAARSVLVNPIIMATVLGILYALSGLALPMVVEQTLSFIGGAARRLPPSSRSAPRSACAASAAASAPPPRWSRSSFSFIPPWPGSPSPVCSSWTLCGSMPG